MELRRITVRGLTPCRDEQTVDLDALPGPLVAVVGLNGAGKSTLLELLHGALYRRLPTRGKLATLATDRDSMLEVAFCLHGRELVARQLVDGVSGKSTIYVDGVPELASGKVRDYDAWAAVHLLSEDVALASLFAAQGSTGLLGAKASERKAILLRALGHDRLERLAEAARERARALRTELAAVAARIEELAGRTHVDRDALQDAANAEAAAREMVCSKREDRHDAEREASEETSRDAERGMRYAKASLRLGLETRLAAGDARLAEIQARVDAAPPAPFPEELAEAITAALLASTDAEASATDARRAAEDVQHADADRRVAEMAARNCGEALRRARETLSAAEAQAPAAELLEHRVRRVAEVEGDVRETEARLRRIRETHVAGAGERIEFLREALRGVRCTAAYTEARGIATNALREDEEAAGLAAALPIQMKDLETRLAAVVAVHAEEREALRDTQRRAQRFEETAASTDVLALELSAAEASVAAAAAAEKVARRREVVAEAEKRAQIDADYARLHVQKRDALQAQANAATAVEADRGRLAEAAPRREQLVAELAQVVADMEMWEPLPEWPHAEAPREWLAKAEAAYEQAKARHREAEQRWLQLEARAADADQAQARVDELTAERAALDIRLADLTRLGVDLGRDGLQALELDAAGPELSVLTTDLLHRAFGPRWTVTFETLRSSADGKREIETLEIRVLDTHTGYEGPVEALSGGERAIVGEAVSLALTVLACRSAGLERPTLIRDETGAALDPDKCEAYIRMLRIAAELVGASRVLFVSHDPRAAELADSRLEIADGVIACATQTAEAAE